MDPCASSLFYLGVPACAVPRPTSHGTRIAPALLCLRQALEISIYDYLLEFHHINFGLIITLIKFDFMYSAKPKTDNCNLNNPLLWPLATGYIQLQELYCSYD